MHDQRRSSLAAFAKVWTLTAGAVALTVGVTVLFGWVWDIRVLKSMAPGLVSMKVNTAIGFVLLGGGLLAWSMGGRRIRLAGQLAGGVASLVGLMTLLQYGLNVDFGLDQWILEDARDAAGTSHPGRMSPLSAMSLLTLGAAIPMLDRLPRGAQWLGLISLLLSLLAVAGYVYGVEQLYEMANLTEMAIHTAATFLVFSLGVLLARHDEWPVSIVTANTVGGLMARRLLPVMALALFGLGGAIAAAMSAGLFVPRFALALFVVASIVVAAAIVWVNAVSLHRMDQQRATAKHERVRQHQWLATTLSSIGDAVLATDELGRVAFLNPVAERMTGWSQTEAAGLALERVFEILDEQTRQPVETPVARVLREGQIVAPASQLLLVAKDGSERPISDSAAPILDADGCVQGVVLVFRDVTEQRVAHQALRESEARKSAMLEMALDCIITMNHEGKIVEFNPAAERTFGYRRQDVLGEELADKLIPPSLREQHHAGMRHYLRTGEGPVLAQRLELAALHADGSEFPIELAITRIPIGGPPMFTAFLRDITGRKRTEQHRNIRLAVNQVLARAADGPDAVRGILQEVGRSLGWDVGFYWSVAEDQSTIGCQESWHRDDVPSTAFETASFNRPFAKGEGLPGEVWSTGKPKWVLDVLAAANFPRADAAEKNGLHGALAIPIKVGDQTLGVMEFFTRRLCEADADLLETMATVAGNIGQFLERWKAEHELRRSEQELADFFENAVVGLHWVGPDGTVLRANRAELDLLGYRADEYVGRSIADFHADQDVIEDILQRLSKGEELRNREARLRCKDGTVKHVLIDSNVLWKGEQFVHTRCFTRDITERKLAEKAVRESEERLRLALEAGRMGSWEWLIGRSEVRWSPTLEAIHGLAEGTFVGTFDAYRRDIHPDDRDRVLHEIAQTVERGRELHLEYRIVWPDGSVHWVEARGKLFRDEAGTPARLIGVCSDVTERKHLEQSLNFLARASESLSLLSDQQRSLQQVAELAVPEFADWCWVYVVDSEKSFRRIAAAHADPAQIALVDELIGRSPPGAEPSRGTMHVLCTGESEMASKISDEMLAEFAASEEGLERIRALNLRSYICVPLQKQQETLGAITFFSAESGRQYGPRDLAMAEELARRTAIALENARLYEELRDTDRRKDEFLAMLAHELRNPLTPIRTGLDLLAMEESIGQDDTVRLMREQVEHLVRLVDDLLDVSRLMRGSIELKRETVSLRSLVERSVAAVDPNIVGRGQTLTVTLPNEETWLHVDPVRMAQVLENLLNNASKYSDVGGVIELRAEIENDELVLSVCDDGAGIEPELLPRVFELFSQSTRTLDRSQGGLGIGLTLVHNLVSLHGGRVAARSDGPGEGSQFMVYLPTHVAPSRLAPDRPQTPPPVVGRRVLVVDDMVGAAGVLARLLRRLGPHEVEVVHDGEAALEIIRQYEPEIVLLDIGLPVMDGFEVARRLRRNPDYDKLLLVALTGYGQAGDRRRAKEAGFDEHMVKPPALEELNELMTHPKLAPRGKASPQSRAPAATARSGSATDESTAAAVGDTPWHDALHEFSNHAHVLSLAASLLAARASDSDADTVQEMLTDTVKSMSRLIESLRDRTGRVPAGSCDSEPVAEFDPQSP